MAKWTYFHHLNPFIIQFTENFGIRWYSMSYIMGFLCGYYLIDRYLIRTQTSALSRTDWADQVAWSVMGIIIGGRLGYALFYSPNLFIAWDTAFPFWGLLKIHQGGLASHGGILGLLITTLLFARKRKLPSLHCLDLVSATAGLGIFFGRCANFINGELYGRVIQGPVLLAVQFPQEIFRWISEKKIEYLKDLSTAVSALNIKSINADIWQDWMYQADLTGHFNQRIYSVIYSLISACEKGNQQVIQALKPVLSYRHPSQIYQAFLEGLLPFILVWFFWRKRPRRTGMVCVLLGICYSTMRLLGEQFRMPDIQLGFRALGFTRGQWLSFIMLAAFLLCWVILLKRKEKPKWGGWKQKS